MKQGLVGCWIVKDLSRFGGNYLEVGRYTELIFPSCDVRFIAIHDGVDSEKDDTDSFSAIKNLFNEWFPKDASKKVCCAPAKRYQRQALWSGIRRWQPTMRRSS